MTAMPNIHLDAVLMTQDETEIVQRIVKPDGTLRASMPPHKDAQGGRAAYVWRMIAFQVSPNPRHHCMPIAAEFNLKDEDWDNRREVIQWLDDLVKRLVDAVSMQEWHGIHRWRRVLG
jgi:hypothetical protein